MIEAMAAKTTGSEHLTGSEHQDTGPDLGGLVPGSIEAKKLWAKISADAHSPANVAKAKAVSGSEKAIGMYKGKPLVPGHQGSAEHPEADFEFLKDKLVAVNGYDPIVAQKIASKARFDKYGK